MTRGVFPLPTFPPLSALLFCLSSHCPAWQRNSLSQSQTQENVLSNEMCFISWLRIFPPDGCYLLTPRDWTVAGSEQDDVDSTECFRAHTEVSRCWRRVSLGTGQQRGFRVARGGAGFVLNRIRRPQTRPCLRLPSARGAVGL